MTVPISDELLDQHRAFHRGRMKKWDNPGEGKRFLQFHSRFIMRVRYDVIGQGKPDPLPSWPRWEAIPEELKVDELPPMPSWWNAMGDCENDDMDDMGNPDVSEGWTPATRFFGDPNYYLDASKFTDDDALGRDIEQDFHLWVHPAASWIYNDRNLRSMSCSPKSECFYAIHGLITFWWNRFRLAKNPPVPNICTFWENLVSQIESDIREARFNSKRLSKRVVDAEIRQLNVALADAKKKVDRCLRRVNDQSDSLFAVGGGPLGDRLGHPFSAQLLEV